MQAITVFTMRVIAPPALRSQLVNSLGALLEPTRVQPGCLGCCLYSDNDDPQAIMLTEEWSSLIELERYLDSDVRKTLIAALELSIEPPLVQIDTIIRRTGPHLVGGLNEINRRGTST